MGEKMGEKIKKGPFAKYPKSDFSQNKNNIEFSILFLFCENKNNIQFSILFLFCENKNNIDFQFAYCFCENKTKTIWF